ncbi:MAG: diaminopimelate epimerase [Hyphomonadaceae bacterium]
MRYVKMNGCGNDFVILDLRADRRKLAPAQARALADRASGIGCDQVIAIEPSAKADAFMRIWNADGGEVSACGNAARCVAWLLSTETGRPHVAIETVSGVLAAEQAGPMRFAVDMGPARLSWTEIPVARETDTVAMDYAIPGGRESWMAGPGGVSMGNPHAVFFPPSAEAVLVAELGPVVEHDPFFPERVNVGFAEIQAPDRIRLRVWERGAGLTKACGTGACAALVAAHRAGLVGRRATVIVDGGALEIEWRADNGHVIMTGPVEREGEGETPL